MINQYPPVAFYFKLSFGGVATLLDASFKEVSGISMEIGTEEIAEGGNNSYKHRVPTSTKYPNLVLKRGLVPIASTLISWCEDTFGGGLATTIKTKTIMVS